MEPRQPRGLPAERQVPRLFIGGKTPRRAGLFEGDDPQDVVPLTRRVPERAVVAVTVERDGGVDAPTSKPIFATSA